MLKILSDGGFWLRKTFWKLYKLHDISEICRELIPAFIFKLSIKISIFAEVFMKKIFWFLPVIIFSCTKQPVHPPVGSVLSQKDLQVSKDRSRSLYELERKQITDWIAQQNKKYYVNGLGYWIDKDLSQNLKRKDGERLSYQYEIYDFDLVKIYDEPKTAKDVYLGKFEDLKAVDDALRYLKPGEEATLLVPSLLAYGTYGDNDKIPNDMPLIIKLTVTH